MSYITVRAGQAVEASCTLSYEIVGDGPYGVLEEGDLLDRVETPEDVLFHIYRRVYRRVLERYTLAGWLLLHAGLITIAGRRMMLLGDKGAGKTTLMTRLLYDGYPFEGDELVLARAGELMSVPRRLHLKPGIEKNVPELQETLDGLPVSFAGDLEIRALDPVELGFEWQISVGLADHLIWISPNHGGATVLESMGSFFMLQRLLESYRGWGESMNAVVECTAGLSRNGGQMLVLGSVESGVSVLESLAKSRL